MARGTTKRLGHASAPGMPRGSCRWVAGGALAQNPSGDAWVMAGGLLHAPRGRAFRQHSPPGDTHLVLCRGRKSRRNRLKQANPPVASQGHPLVTMQALQLSPQWVTPKNPAAFSPSRRAAAAPCPGVSSTHRRDHPSCSRDAQPERIFHTGSFCISVRERRWGAAAQQAAPAQPPPQQRLLPPLPPPIVPLLPAAIFSPCWRSGWVSRGGRTRLTSSATVRGYH